MAAVGADGSRKKSSCIVFAALFSIILMLLASCVLIDSDESSADGSGDLAGDIHWEQSGSTLRFTGTGAMPDYSNVDMVRPWERDAVQFVVIGNGITSIGEYTFNMHTNIESVTFGEDIAMIDTGAFNNCQNISSLCFPVSVQTINESAFARCIGLTEVSFSNLSTLGDYAFDQINFYDLNQNLLPNTRDSLSGKTFQLNDYGHLTDKGWRIIFKSNGGSSVPEQNKYNMDYAVRPENPIKDGYLFKDWYSDNACTIPFVFETTFVDSMKILYADWNEAITVTFDSNTGTGTMLPQVLVKSAPTALAINSFTKDHHHFSGWNSSPDGTGESYTDGESVSFSTNVTLYAIWGINKYPVRFLSEGEEFKVYNLSIGTTIPQPPTDPTKATDSKYEYRFSHWEGYTDTLTTEGATFTAVFDKMIKMNKDGSRLTLVDSEESKMEFTSDRIDMIVTMATTDPDLTMSVNLENCLVHFDNAALRSLKVADAELSISKLSYDDLSSAQKKVIGNHTVYDLKFGDNTDFKGGKVTFTVPYSLEDGKSADDLYVAYVSDGSVAEEIECEYDNGELTFSTGHLSIYSFFYREAKKTGFLSDLDFGSFLTIGIIAAIAMSGIILFVLKKLK